MSGGADFRAAGHAVWRRRGSRDWVLLGRLTAYQDDEVWTRSKKVLRVIRKCLRDDEYCWMDSYVAKSGNRYEKPFVQRNIAERELHAAIGRIMDDNTKINFTLQSNNRDGSIGLIVDRVFELLVEDRVLVTPTAKAFRPVAESSVVSKGEVSGRPITRGMVWAVDQEAADDWLAVRLLLLEPAP